jgi:hypothetical protein
MYYFSHSLVLAIIPFIAAAISVDPPSIRNGVAIPITKRSSNFGADLSEHELMVQGSIA